MTLDGMRDRLLKENNYFRSLNDRHQECEREIHELSKRQYVSEQDERLKTELKKKKLQLKEEMEQLLRASLNGSGAPAR